MERESARASGQEMHRRVSEAALSGSVDTLNALIKEDPLILDRISTTWFDETPLHIAVLRGHLDFTKALLSQKPKFSTEVDLLGRLPLHLACVEGYVEIVRELLHVNPDTCFVRDHDGRIPVHLAVMKGRIEVIKELIQARPNSIMDKLDHGETVLHLSVRHNHLEALKLLVEGANNDVFVNSKDENGNTTLHVAAMHKREEIIKYLLSDTAIKENSNALNDNSFTALDVLEQCPRDLKGMEIRDFLLQAGVERAKVLKSKSALPPSPSPQLLHLHSIPGFPGLPSPQRRVEDTCTFWPLTRDKVKRLVSKAGEELSKKGKLLIEISDKNWLNLARNNLMTVATLTATVTFAAGVNPPGGVWQDTDENHEAGTSILATVHLEFFRYNTLAFLLSLLMILTSTCGLHNKYRTFMWFLTLDIYAVVSCMVLAYIESLKMIIPPQAWNKQTIYSHDLFLMWWVLMANFAIIEVYRLGSWIRDKVQRRQASPSMDTPVSA